MTQRAMKADLNQTMVWPRDFIAEPASFHDRNLNDPEQRFWFHLNSNFAPFVIGDEAGDIDDDLPTPRSLSWCALYPLAIYFMEATVRDIPNAEIISRPQGPQYIPWTTLLGEYWGLHERKTKAFQSFLEDWTLNNVLGIDASPATAGPKSDFKNPFGEDRKVLGRHRFKAWKDVTKYALRWATNPLIRDTDLWQHRITVSRGIDLICSEILANGFEHSGKNGSKEVFIMAKLCSRSSAWLALELEKNIPYLTATEKQFFRFAVDNNCPLLQLCIRH